MREAIWQVDANQPVAVAIARTWFHLNYRNARMSMKREGDNGVRYRCRRRGAPETAEFEYPLAGGTAAAARPGSLEFRLDEIWVFSHRGCADEAPLQHKVSRDFRPSLGFLQNTLKWSFEVRDRFYITAL